MKYIKPEEAGISSDNIREYLDRLEKGDLSTHNIILMRGNDILFEKYWKPFHKNFLHRMYSVTKSFVGIAIGFLEQDGVLSLDDKIVDYFPEENKNQSDENMKKQTIRDMLQMRTSRQGYFWFGDRPKDRVDLYFNNDKITNSREPGGEFIYDSDGSFVMGALVEKLTGKKLLEYLREKCLDKIGFSKEAYMLSCPGGWSWGDSALMCKPTDLLKFARFLLNYGKWDGEQLLNEEYIRTATSKLVDNYYMGYGYQIWKAADDSFTFFGMGSQYAVAVPGKDIIMEYNGDDQGRDVRSVIFDNFFELIVHPAKDAPLPENPAAEKALEERTSDLKLAYAKGEKETPVAEKINGVTYKLSENPMGITKMRIVLDGANSRLEYTNAQGEKTLYFGICENAFGDFPQEGYSNEVGSVRTKGFYYKCAASAAWQAPNVLFLKVQVIDIYFGRLDIVLTFEGDEIKVKMQKAAEDFLDEYKGEATGTAE